MSRKKQESPWTFRPDDDVVEIASKLIEEGQGGVVNKNQLINEAIRQHGHEAAESILMQQQAVIDVRLKAIRAKGKKKQSPEPNLGVPARLSQKIGESVADLSEIVAGSKPEASQGEGKSGQADASRRPKGRKRGQ